jgi:hypothetical protein
VSEWRPASPGRAELRSALRTQAAELESGARLIASDLLAAESSIDLLLAGEDGAALVVVIAEAGQELAALARAAAHLGWVAARLRDWRKLAPELPLRPERPVRALVLARDPGSEVQAAAEALTMVKLRRFQPVETPDGLRVLLFPPAAPGAQSGTAPGWADAGSPPVPKLRTSLGDAELGLSAEEVAAFED